MTPSPASVSEREAGGHASFDMHAAKWVIVRRGAAKEQTALYCGVTTSGKMVLVRRWFSTTKYLGPIVVIDPADVLRPGTDPGGPS